MAASNNNQGAKTLSPAMIIVHTFIYYLGWVAFGIKVALGLLQVALIAFAAFLCFYYQWTGILSIAVLVASIEFFLHHRR